MDDLSYTLPETIKRIRIRIAVGAVIMVTASVVIPLLRVMSS